MKLEVSLSRAHKIADRIKAQANEMIAKAQELGAVVHVTGTTGPLVERLKGQGQEAVSVSSKAVRYLMVAASVRTSIASANEARGINAMLANLEAVNRAVVHVKALIELGKSQGVEASELADYKPLAGAESRYSSGISVVVLGANHLTQLQGQLKELQKEAFTISDKIAEANGPRVVLELPEDIAAEVSGA